MNASSKNQAFAAKIHFEIMTVLVDHCLLPASCCQGSALACLATSVTSLNGRLHLE